MGPRRSARAVNEKTSCHDRLFEVLGNNSDETGNTAMELVSNVIRRSNVALMKFTLEGCSGIKLPLPAHTLMTLLAELDWSKLQIRNHELSVENVAAYDWDNLVPL